MAAEAAVAADLPCNLEEEHALLGALMQKNELVDPVGDLLSAEDFFEPLHQRIYTAICAAVARGTIATPVTLKPLFQDDQAMNEIGGTSYLARMTEGMIGLVGWSDFAKDIASLARRRRLALDLRTALAELLDDEAEKPVAEIAESIDAASNAAIMGNAAVRPSMTIARILDDSMRGIVDEAEGRTPPGVTTALLPDWNAITGGMRAGEVTVLAARPKMGKTATAISIALGAAQLGSGVAYLSLEMKGLELGKRMISDLMFDYGNCPTYSDIKANRLNAADIERYNDLRRRIETWPMEIIDHRGVKIGRIAAMIRRLKRQFKARGQDLKLVVIDYLQLVRPDKSRSRYEDVGEISRTLKEIAGETDVSILLLAQVNRECEKREDKRPMPFDLRDAGDIEQDADTICFLYREEVYLKLAQPEQFTPGYEAWSTKLQAATDRIEIYSAARRNGETMRRNCHFFAMHQAVRGSDYFKDRNL